MSATSTRPVDYYKLRDLLQAFPNQTLEVHDGKLKCMACDTFLGDTTTVLHRHFETKKHNETVNPIPREEITSRLVQKRLREFPDESLEMRDQELFCSKCDLAIPLLTTYVKQHIASKKHRADVNVIPREELKHNETVNPIPLEEMTSRLFQKRLRDFPDQSLEMRGQELFCSKCEVHLSLTTSSIRQHVDTRKHQRFSARAGAY